MGATSDDTSALTPGTRVWVTVDGRQAVPGRFVAVRGALSEVHLDGSTGLGWFYHHRVSKMDAVSQLGELA